MNELERKLYLKYRNIENVIQLFCLKLYQLRLFKKTSFFFYFFTSFKCTSRLHKKNLSNELSNPSTNFGLELKQPEF